MITNSYEFQEGESRSYKHGKPIAVPVKFCTVCRGLTPTCMICKKAQHVRNLFPELVAHCKYVRQTWEKLRRFRVFTTGCDSLDRECRRMFGPWLILSTSELLSLVCLRLVRKYELQMVDAIDLVERNRVCIQNTRRLDNFNKALAIIAIKEGLKENPNGVGEDAEYAYP